MSGAAVIHPSAVVEDGARIADGAHVGPLCHIGADVTIGEGTRLVSSVVVMGVTTLGRNNIVYPGAVLGAPPQNHAHKGGRTTLTVGDGCTIREFVTMHTGSDNARGATTVGNNCNMLAYSHIAHDCVVGDNCTLTNGVTLGGHVHLGNNVGIGGLAAVHQFVRVGEFAFLAGGSMTIGDVIPFAIAEGNRSKLRGLNLVGLRRSGMNRADMHRLRSCYLAIFNPDRPMSEGLAEARDQFGDFAPAMKIVEFLSNRGKRPFTVPPLGGGQDDDADGLD